MATATKKVQLLIDHVGVINPKGGRLLIERSEGGKIVLKGEIGKADIVTSNNRMYPRQLVEREIKRLQKEAQGNKLYGELDHPADGRTQFQRVSHRIRDIKLNEDGSVYGELELIPTAKGKDLIAIVESGGAVGVSSRGTGTTHKREDNVDVVNDDYTMITYDVVADPAHTAAYPEVFFESKDVKNLGRVLDMPKSEAKNENVDIDAIVKSKVQETLEKHREAMRAEEREKLKAQFESNLLAQTEEMKKEALENAKSEILSDPKIADAKNRVEAIRSIIGSTNESEAIKGYEAKLAEADAKIQSLAKELAEMTADRDRIATVAKKNAVSRYVEQQSRNVANPDLFRELLKGKVSESDTAETLKAKVAEALAVIKKFEATTTAKVEDVKKESGNIDAKIKQAVEAATNGIKTELDTVKKQNEDLLAKNESIKSLATRSMEVGKRGYTEALKTELAESKLGSHPARHKIRRLLEEANCTTREEIERFLDKAILAEGKNSDLYDKVRATVRKSDGAILTEHGEEKGSRLTETPASEAKLFGTPMAQIRRLAGVK